MLSVFRAPVALEDEAVEDIRTLETMAGGFITSSSHFVDSTFTWPVSNQAEGHGGLAPPLFLDKTDARRPLPPYLRVWMTAPPRPAYLKVWIRHWWHYLFLSSLQEEIKNICCFFPSFLYFRALLGMKGYCYFDRLPRQHWTDSY